MLCHLLLGFLRDGRARHGYDLLIEYRALTGERLNAGNLYRELARLARGGFVHASSNPPDADPRRIPYEITDRGTELFDHWLASPSGQDGDFPAWVVFIERVPPDVRSRVLDHREEALWMQSKTLARDRSNALTNPANAGRQFHPLSVLLSRRMKLVTAEVEFLAEFRELLRHLARVEPSIAPSESAPVRSRGVGRPRMKKARK